MKIQEKDFIEVDFTGKTKDGGVFDSTIKSELEKLHAGHSHEIKAKPLIFCVGQGMFLDSLEKFFVGKELKKEYEVELSPEEAFGQRNPSLIQKISLKIFEDKKINPVPGASLNFDGRIGKIIAVSGGRVVVDFNNPLAGKIVRYKINALRKIEDINEKIKSMNEFFFRRDFDFEIKAKEIILRVDKNFAGFVKLFEDKFKEALGFDLKIEEIEPKKSESKKAQ